MSLPINTLILIIFLAGVVVLQIFLSKRENKWFGLFLPSINFAFSIIAVLGSYMYMNQAAGEFIIQILAGFLLFNIPTIILIVIYFACREKLKKNKEIDKMNIQDLD